MSDHVALVYGFWGQNIGNAFFNLGGRRVLEEALGAPRLKLIQDQPAYWTFHDERKGNYANTLPLLAELEVETVVVQGPVLTPNFGEIWRPTLTALRKHGMAWGGIGIGLRKYSPSERSSVAEVLREVPPRFLSTRDSDTFDYLRSLGLRGCELRSGIDSAFFCPLAYEPPASRGLEQSIAICFDHYPEPRLDPDPDGVITIAGGRYSAVSSVWRSFAAQRGKAVAIATRLRRQNAPTHVGAMRIVRPRHRTNPHLPLLLYGEANCVASDEPYTYLTVYANTALTLSDRVHACVASMAYGNEAMLFNPRTKRASLFDAVGAASIGTRPCRVPFDRIEEEFAGLTHFLQRSM